MITLEEAEKQNTSFAKSITLMDALIKISLNCPTIRHYYSDPYLEKKETKLVEYQHRESKIERVLFRDRQHPIDPVLIHNFNEKTGNNIDNAKIIYGPSSDEYTRSYHALAVVLADTILFRNGAYKPESEEGRELIAHELTHIAQNKNKEDYRTVSKEEKEEEAEWNESSERYNPDPIITKIIKGKEYKLKKSQWKKIINNAISGLNSEILKMESEMSEEEYLNLLLKFEKWEMERKTKWEV